MILLRPHQVEVVSLPENVNFLASSSLASEKILNSSLFILESKWKY